MTKIFVINEMAKAAETRYKGQKFKNIPPNRVAIEARAENPAMKIAKVREFCELGVCSSFF
jgi:hypothetical protein